MDYRKFAAYLFFVALVGLLGSWVQIEAGTHNSPIHKILHQDEIDRRYEQASLRARQHYADSKSVQETVELEAVEAERVSSGKTAQVIFAAVGILGIGLYLSAK